MTDRGVAGGRRGSQGTMAKTPAFPGRGSQGSQGSQASQKETAREDPPDPATLVVQTRRSSADALAARLRAARRHAQMAQPAHSRGRRAPGGRGPPRGRASSARRRQLRPEGPRGLSPATSCVQSGAAGRCSRSTRTDAKRSAACSAAHTPFDGSGRDASNRSYARRGSHCGDEQSSDSTPAWRAHRCVGRGRRGLAGAVRRQAAAAPRPGRPGAARRRDEGARLGLHPETLVRMARNKRVPGARKIGRSWRFPAGEIDIRAATDTHIPEPAPARRGGPGDAATSAIRGA